MESYADDESTLVPDHCTERTLLCGSDLGIPPSCHFLSLPLDIRKRIYRFYCISDAGCTSHPRLWAPSEQGVSWNTIGYFEYYTVLPTLLLCRQIHDEAAAVLYGENIFIFHLTVVSQGPILFFQWLAPRYVRLLRKIYIRTGFNVDTYNSGCGDEASTRYGRYDPPALTEFQTVRNLSVSADLLKQAGPSMYGVKVDRQAILSCSKQDDRAMWTKVESNDWPRAAYHLWKMVATKKDGEDFRPEFKRVQWVEQFPTRGTCI